MPPSSAELINDLVINLVDLRPELRKDIGEDPPEDLKRFIGGIRKHYESSPVGRGKTADPIYSGW